MDFKQVRVIAYDATKKNLRTVNVSTTVSGNNKKHLQVTAANTVAGITATVMASPTVDPTKPTIGVAGYAGPN